MEAIPLPLLPTFSYFPGTMRKSGVSEVAYGWARKRKEQDGDELCYAINSTGVSQDIKIKP